MLFNDIENVEKKDQKLNFLERSIILASTGIVKIILRKFKRAKTYGDIMKLVDFIDANLPEDENSFIDDNLSDEINTSAVKIKIDQATEEIKNL